MGDADAGERVSVYKPAAGRSQSFLATSAFSSACVMATCTSTEFCPYLPNPPAHHSRPASPDAASEAAASGARREGTRFLHLGGGSAGHNGRMRSDNLAACRLRLLTGESCRLSAWG